MKVGRDGLWSAALTLVVTLAGSGLAGSGCSSARSQNAADGSTVLAACGWPSSLDRTDAAGGQCVAARTYLSCSRSDGVGELCLSDDASQCPGPNAVGGESFGNCQDLCRPDEYAVACGGIGPGPWPSPPAECRALPPSPGGGSVACCPCASDAHPAPVDGEIFDCGGTMTCDASSQICQHVGGGAPPGVNFYSCTEIPTECSGHLTCACVTTALLNRGAGACSAAGNQITVQINVP